MCGSVVLYAQAPEQRSGGARRVERGPAGVVNGMLVLAATLKIVFASEGVVERDNLPRCKESPRVRCMLRDVLSWIRSLFGVGGWVYIAL